MIKVLNSFDPVNRSNSGNSNIKLTMSENWSAKIKSNIFHRLTLGLVDGHCKGQANRKLTTTKFKRKLSIRRRESDARDENMFSSMISTEQSDFQHFVGHARQNASCAIAHTLSRIHVAPDHYALPHFDCAF